MSHPPGPPHEGDSNPQDPYPGPAGQQPGYPPPGYGQQPGYGSPGPSTSGKALASLITGISALVLAFCSCGLGGLVGIVAVFLGFSGRGDIKASAGHKSGAGVALGGIITGVLATVIGLAAIAFFVWAISTGNTEFSTDPSDPYGSDPSDPFNNDFDF